MKTNIKTAKYLLGSVVCAGALLTAAGASAQNLFVSDFSANNIYEYTPGGTQSIFASGMNNPFDIAFNAAGNLFVANTADNGPGGSITEITRGGTQSTFASGLDPIAMDFYGNTLFTADYSSGNIYEFTPSGMRSTFATGFTTPISMTFDSAGDMFVGSGYGNGNGIITKITPGGTKSLFASGLSFPGGMTFNGAGNLLVTEQGSGTILQYTPGGVQSTFANLNYSGLNCLAYNSAGDLFVAVPTGPIVEITPNGGQSVFATVSAPVGVAFQPVPEPSVMALGALGAVAFFARRRK
ncbi:MAG TPA: PEP-CTERM sorting domain-containing protein [Pseudomonadales bacterium]|nr:PEP-CTERM sorting domain-containing protein [Pseudomonadales bacterium]